MPIHDWTRVSSGTWHAFHLAWIAEIQNALNGGCLPPDYYALAEQIIGPFGPDVLTLQETPHNDWTATHSDGGIAVETSSPQTRWIVESDKDDCIPKQRTISIRHSSDDRIVARLELVSPGNKASEHAVKTFVEKAIETLSRGYHLMIIDLFPPACRDLNGQHGEIWKVLDEDTFRLSLAEPLVQASYSAGHKKVAYIEPTTVGKQLMDMPLFLTADRYVPVPLQATYDRAYQGLPKRWQRVLEESQMQSQEKPHADNRTTTMGRKSSKRFAICRLLWSTRHLAHPCFLEYESQVSTIRTGDLRIINNTARSNLSECGFYSATLKTCVTPRRNSAPLA